MNEFAFRVSWTDLIRKIGYRYEHPVDYVASLIGKLYDPGARVDITLDPSTIEVRSDAPTAASVFDEALKGSPLDSTFVIPPVSEYAAVRILSGRRGILVDIERDIHRADPDEYHHGTVITILRDQRAPRDGCRQDGDSAVLGARLESLYWGSDLRVTVNGRALHIQAYKFKTGVIEGAVCYDPTRDGCIRYYAQGRFIEREPFIDGVDILVHRHPFRTTLTNSHLIRSGEEHLQMQRQLPDIMAGYLESPQVLELAKRSPYSSRVLCQTILSRFPQDERLRLLADRLAHPEGARVPGLGPATAAGPTGRMAPSRAAGSRGGLPLRVKVLVLCSLTALCLGVWTHSSVHRPPPGAQTSTSSAGPRVGSISTSPPGPEPPVPASFGSPKDSAGASVRTGQNSVTPPGYRDSGPAPGLNYSSTTALAEDLAHMEEEAEKRGTSGEGYVPGSTFNVLTMFGGHLEWSGRPPYDTLSDSIQHPVWSPEFARVSGHADGIRAVRSYLDGFSYGAIPPDVGRRYPDDLSAILGVRKVDCVASNTLAAHLLFELGYRKVEAVTGTRGGCRHMWLSVWEDGQWRIEDFTPARMSPDFARACSANSVSLPGAMGGASDVPATQTLADSGDSDRSNAFTSAPETLDSPAQPSDQRSSGKFFDLCTLLAVLCLAYSVASSVLGKRRSTVAVVGGNGSAAAEIVRDLLDIEAVNTGAEVGYNRRTRTLTLDAGDMSVDGPFASAVKAVPLVRTHEERQQALYRSLAKRILR